MEPNGHEEARLLSEDVGARYLGVSKWALRDLIHRGDIPRVRIGRRVLVDVRDLDAYVQRVKIQYGP